MDQPSYKLEVFEGPLDLLLSLLKKNKIDIYDIPISLILDQYLEYLEQAEALSLEISGEFIDMASQLMSGMAIVIICGLSYATLMTLYIVPVLYDMMFKKPPLNVDIGSDEDLDDIPDDAAEFIAAQSSAAQPQPEA